MVEIVSLSGTWRAWAAELVAGRWGGTAMVTRGKVHHLEQLPGFVALHDGRPAGLAHYRLDGAECELMSLDSLLEGRGIGTALIEAVRGAARAAGCRRLWLITTNDNLYALGFYQKRGFRLVAVHPGALEQSRRLKPAIPAIGQNGIPLRDELELEIEP